MLVAEIFVSIQGESTFSGLPCVFVRLAGCNLDCPWCDTQHAKTTSGARDFTVDEIAERVRGYDVELVEITGGEPLLQDETPELAETLLAEGRKVLLETNGSVSLERVDPKVVKVVDVKCPSSKSAGSFLEENLDCIDEKDEVKFVVADRDDYEYARGFVTERLGARTRKVLFAPARPALAPSVLARWILEDGLGVRLQVQLHKYIWHDSREGEQE